LKTNAKEATITLDKILIILISLTKEVKDLYKEDYKTLKKEIEGATKR
jgi:hypothetical protein